MLTRREVLETLGTLAIGSIVATRAVQATIGDGGAISAQELRLNAVAGPDRIVMQQGRTYLNGWGGYGEPPRRTRGRRGEAPPAPPPDPGPAPSMTWNKVSGPGTVTFADANAASYDGELFGAWHVRPAGNGRQRSDEVFILADGHRRAAPAVNGADTGRHETPHDHQPALVGAHEGAHRLVDPSLHRPDESQRSHAGPWRHGQLHRGG